MFVWGSFGLGKGLVSRMLLGGSKVECAAHFCSGLGLLQGCCCASFGLGLVVGGKAPTTDPKPAQNSHNPALKQPQCYCKNVPHTQRKSAPSQPKPTRGQPYALPTASASWIAAPCRAQMNQTNPRLTLIKTSAHPKPAPSNSELPPNQSQ